MDIYCLNIQEDRTDIHSLAFQEDRTHLFYYAAYSPLFKMLYPVITGGEGSAIW